MTRIRATCPSCGEIELTPLDIELRIVGTSTEDVQAGSAYAFDCPSCCDEISKPADARIVALLAGGGVAATFLDDPAFAEQMAAARMALSHPEGIQPGPPLTHDDLLDLHELLRSDDWFDSLVATLG